MKPDLTAGTSDGSQTGPRAQPPLDPHPEALPERALRSAFDNAPIGMVVLTPTGVVTACNAALGELLGRAPHTLVGTTLFEVTHPSDLDAAQHNCTLIQSGTVRIVRHECRFVRADDTIVWVLVSTSRVPETTDHPAHLIMHIEHISDRKALEAELIHQALHGPLTGLPNRTQLTTRLNDVLDGRGRHARPTCLLYVDLNGFKAVNDRYGHASGDELLRQLARRVTDHLRPGDLCARLGGDEFAVLCADTDAEQGEVIAERLRRTVAEPFRIEDRDIVLTAAVGISTATSDAGHPSQAIDLLRDADERMYHAKRHRQSGGNQDHE